MEPSSPAFSEALFTHVSSKIPDSKAATFQNVFEAAKGYLNQFGAVHVQFYEAFLLRNKYHENLAIFYFYVGEYEKALALAKEKGLKTSIYSCELSMGIDESSKPFFDGTPPADCSLDELTLWLTHHDLHRTLLSKAEGYAHNTSDGNALIQMYLGNYQKATYLLQGDVLSKRELIHLKAYCALLDSCYVSALALFELLDKEDKEDLSPPCFVNILLYARLVTLFFPKKDKDKFFNSLPLLSLDSALYFESTQTNSQFIHTIAKAYPNSLTKFYVIIRTKLTESVALRALDTMQKGRRVNALDQMVKEYYLTNGHPEFLETYGKMRFKEFPHPYFVEMILTGLHARGEDFKEEWLVEAEEWIETYKKLGADLRNIAGYMGYALLQRGKSTDAREQFTLFHRHFGHTTLSVIGFFLTLQSLQKPKEAAQFIVDAANHLKDKRVLKVAELALEGNHEALLRFYDHNFYYVSEFKAKRDAVKDALEKEAYEIYKDHDPLSLSSDMALRVLNYKIKHNIDCPRSYSIRAYHHYQKHFSSGVQSDLEERFRHPVSPKDQEEFSLLYRISSDFMRRLLDFFPKDHPYYLPYKAHVYFDHGEWQEALDIYKVLLRSSDNVQYQVRRIICFYELGNFMSARFYLDELRKAHGVDPEFDSKLACLQDDIEKKERENPSKKEVPAPPKPSREEKKPQIKEYNDPFKFEPSVITEAKQAHLNAAKNRGMAPAVHSGSKSVKGAVDPIEHKKRFDPRAYKPAETETALPAIAAKPAPKTAPTPLFKTKLTLNERSRIEYAIERLKYLIHLEELVQKGEYDKDILHRNSLYTYLRVFGILTELANPPLKDHLYNIRNQARHDFIVSSSVGCKALLQHLKEIKLVTQLEDWIKGATVPSFAVSPYSLLDKEKNRHFENLPYLAKDANRIQFMKDEIDHLTRLKEPVRTLELFQSEGFYQNDVKMSLMMIAKSWTKLNPILKAKLAEHFRDLNLEGNTSAHVFKNETKHDNIIFKLNFEDISTEWLWNFAQKAGALKQILIGIN